MIATPSSARDMEKTQIDMLLTGIRDRYGYDFTHYSRASLKRRIDRVRCDAQLPDYMELLDRLIHDGAFFDEFLRGMSITVTDMFRDPLFYRAIREKIVPMLKTFPFVKIWHAGCATGEEVYSMAILLHEEDFLGRVRIYATDFNSHSLNCAQQGVYAAKNMTTYETHYRAAGGSGKISDYYSAGYDFVKIKDSFKERITFAYHNLVTDGVFGEMNLIFCRNVLIYFDGVLQNHVLTKLADSLRHRGFLCLGNRESLRFTSVKPLFAPVDEKQRIYEKCG